MDKLPVDLEMSKKVCMHHHTTHGTYHVQHPPLVLDIDLNTTVPENQNPESATAHLMTLAHSSLARFEHQGALSSIDDAISFLHTHSGFECH